MYTQDHILWGYLVGRRTKSSWAAVFGSVVPDIPSLIAGGVLYFNGIRSNILGRLYEVWWYPFLDTLLHSFIVLLFLYTILSHPYSGRIFIFGWFVHLVIDLFTHVTDGIVWFWPLSGMRVQGFISYWQPEYGSRVFAAVNYTGLALAYLWLGIHFLCTRKTK